MKFILDTNIFIEAKNRYYSFDICPGFWDWMDAVCGQDVGSIQTVCSELMDGRDELATWAKDRKNADWFLPIDDEVTQTNFAAIAEHVATGQYSDSAVEKFLAKADPWLIAKALAVGAKVVTHETAEPASKKRVPIPNVANHFGVQCVNTFDALRHFAAVFKL